MPFWQRYIDCTKLYEKIEIRKGYVLRLVLIELSNRQCLYPCMLMSLSSGHLSFLSCCAYISSCPEPTKSMDLSSFIFALASSSSSLPHVPSCFIMLLMSPHHPLMLPYAPSCFCSLILPPALQLLSCLQMPASYLTLARLST